MMRYFSLAITVLLISSQCHGQSISKSLEYAFKKSNLDSLKSILHDWNQNIRSNESSAHNETERSIYSVFNEFYTPFHLERIGSSEWGDSLYLNKMAIIQNEIEYAIAEFPNPDTIIIALKDDTLSLSDFEKKYGKDDRRYRFYESLKYPKVESNSEIKIIDFRPETILPKDRKLYLTTAYRNEIAEFLGNQYTPLGTGGIMNPARASKKSFHRQAFLNNYLMVVYGHWGGYWHLETHPEVTLIIIDPSLTKALVYFRLVYEGGEAYLEQKNGQWQLINSQLTWIE